MIAGVHPWVGLIAIPEFPDGGSTILGHIAPGRILTVTCQSVSHIGKAIIRQTSHQPRDTYHTTGYTILIVETDVLNNLTDHILPAILGYDAKSQRQDIGCCSVIAVINGVRIEHVAGTWRCASFDGEETLVECLSHLLGCLSPFIAFAVLQDIIAPCCHQLDDMNHICCR